MVRSSTQYQPPSCAGTVVTVTARSAAAWSGGALSKISAPLRTVGIWNVSSPSTRPISVFGEVQMNPSQVGLDHLLR